MKVIIELFGERFTITDGVITGEKEYVEIINRAIKGIITGPGDGEPILAALAIAGAPYKVIEIITSPIEEDKETVY